VSERKRLWIDDLRPAPPGWDWATTSQQALDLMAVTTYDDMAFDHDLGGDDTSRRIVLHLCESERWPTRVWLLTANPVGREWLHGMITRYGPGVIPGLPS
jgi:hypothetical protein